eukprot:GHVR01149275.1.p1 GENE.GHVR01149275.1~~GHVR01149275.1.p1  ORF type:complete len:222 (+),score=83.31 GHVR01149275.1:36-701(+)
MSPRNITTTPIEVHYSGNSSETYVSYSDNIGHVISANVYQPSNSVQNESSITIHEFSGFISSNETHTTRTFMYEDISPTLKILLNFIAIYQPSNNNNIFNYDKYAFVTSSSEENSSEAELLIWKWTEKQDIVTNIKRPVSDVLLHHCPPALSLLWEGSTIAAIFADGGVSVWTGSAASRQRIQLPQVSGGIHISRDPLDEWVCVSEVAHTHTHTHTQQQEQ